MSSYRYCNNADSSAENSIDDDSSLSSFYSNFDSNNDPEWMRKFAWKIRNSFIDRVVLTTPVRDRVASNNDGEDEFNNSDRSTFEPDWIRKFNKFRLSDLNENDVELSKTQDDKRKLRISKADRRERIRQNLRRLKNQGNRRRGDRPTFDDKRKNKCEKDSAGITKMTKKTTESFECIKNVAVNSNGSTECDQSKFKTDIKPSKNIIMNKIGDKKMNTIQSRRAPQRNLAKSSTKNLDFNSCLQQKDATHKTKTNNHKNKNEALRNQPLSPQVRKFSISLSINSDSSLYSKVYPNSDNAFEATTLKMGHRKNNNILQSSQKADTEASTRHQAVIETSVPDNVMGMWGATLKSKKPENSTLMTYNMIKSQADRVKERIEKARKEAGYANDNPVGGDTDEIGEKSSRIQIDPNESASALFFGKDEGLGRRQDSVSLNNSAAALFGFHNKAKNEEVDKKKKNESTANELSGQNSSMIDNSTAAIFGFQVTNKNKDDDGLKSTSFDDDDAAALFYGAKFSSNESFGKNTTTKDKSNKYEDDDELKSKSFDDDAAALFYGAKFSSNESFRKSTTTKDKSTKESFDIRATNKIDKHEDDYREESKSFDDDAAALFYEAKAITKEISGENTRSMDNSAAALFGPTTTTKDDDEDRLKLTLFDDDATSLFYGTGAVINNEDDNTNMLKSKSERISNSLVSKFADDHNYFHNDMSKITQSNAQSEEKRLLMGDSDIDSLDIDDSLRDNDLYGKEQIAFLSKSSEERKSRLNDSVTGESSGIKTSESNSHATHDYLHTRECAQLEKKSWLNGSDSGDSTRDTEVKRKLALKNPIKSPLNIRSWLDHSKTDKNQEGSMSKKTESDDSSTSPELGTNERKLSSRESPAKKKSSLVDLRKKDKTKFRDGDDKESKKKVGKKEGKKNKSRSGNTKKKKKKVIKIVKDCSKKVKERKKNEKGKDEESTTNPQTPIDERGCFSCSEFAEGFVDNINQVHKMKRKKSEDKPKYKKSKDSHMASK